MSGKAIVFRWANNDSDSLTMFFSQDDFIVDMSLKVVEVCRTHWYGISASTSHLFSID